MEATCPLYVHARICLHHRMDPAFKLFEKLDRNNCMYSVWGWAGKSGYDNTILVTMEEYEIKCKLYLKIRSKLFISPWIDPYHQNIYSIYRSVLGKCSLLGKYPYTTFQGVTIAVSIQMYGILIMSECPCGPKSRVIFKHPWAITRDTTVQHKLYYLCHMLISVT